MEKEGNYCYFPLSHYFDQKEPLIDPSLVEKLRNGGTLLSVGVGKAFLEEFLQKGFDLPQESIELADLHLTQEAKQTGLKTIGFDMTKSWPAFEKKFNYIIFPESFGVAYLGKTGNSHIQHSFNVARPIIEKVKAGQIDQISETDKKTFLELTQKELEKVDSKYRTIKQAFEWLDSFGEIRLVGHSISEDEMTCIILRLKSEYGDSVEITTEPILTIKKVEVEKENQQQTN